MSRCMKLQSHSGFMSVGDNTGGIVLSFIIEFTDLEKVDFREIFQNVIETSTLW